MLTSRSPCFTRLPSRKCTASTTPETRERNSTRSMASSRPENSAQWHDLARLDGGDGDRDRGRGGGRRVALRPAGERDGGDRR